ncbi:unnamed protein product [Ciceribacter sp. T2.26MG-112.2]|nr:unnamed protein product [Ciceribacter naphthalenivorans]
MLSRCRLRDVITRTACHSFAALAAVTSVVTSFSPGRIDRLMHSGHCRSTDNSDRLTFVRRAALR